MELYGLENAEVTYRREQYGTNELPAEKKETMMEMLVGELKDPLVMILLVATIVSGAIGELVDACIMVAVVIINAGIGVMQKRKAEKSLASLKKMNLPHVECLRSGTWQIIPTTQLVVGDVVSLKTGMYIPADVEIMDSVSLQIDESALTGESIAVDKENGDEAYMSTSITYGKSFGKVIAVGPHTEIGKIANLLQEKDDKKTPLQMQLGKLSEKLGLLALGVCFIMFIVGIMQGRDFFDMLLLAISLAVAAIPEGLVAIVSIVLALGTSKMAKKQAVTRHLHAIETLGCVSYICSDKTGTLTQNEMSVLDTFSFNDNGRLALGMLLNNNVSVIDGDFIGDASEVALVKYYGPYEDLSSLNERFCRVSEIPFDSKTKKMQVVVKEDDHFVAYEKGALEVILPLCNRVLENGHVVMMDETHQMAVLDAQKRMSEKALRVLALAYQPLSSKTSPVDHLVFVGLVGMMDPCRPEAKAAIQQCREAGIEVTMITGDHPDTAFAIAKELGLTYYPKQVMTSQQLNELTDRQLADVVESVRVFARTKPEDKVRIVEALKKHQHIVSMTGDGVNDAPALKKANVGIAMGLSGTDVAKDASDIILMDDHFKTIVDAIEAGRQIYVNIRQTIWYLLSCNLGEIMALFSGIILLNKEAALLSPVMLLWVNLVTDAFPALCLGMMTSADDLMKEKPRNPKESLFSHGGFIFMVTNGLLIGLLSLVAYRYGLNFSRLHASTMAFMVLSMSQLVHTLNFISMKKSIFKVNLKPYRILFGVVGILIVLQVCCVHVFPFNWLLKTTALNVEQWLMVLGLSIVPIAYNEIVKWFSR